MAVYVPGMIRDSNGDWVSCNRTGGTAKILDGTDTWVQMTTEDGPTATDNPPYIMHSDEVFHNQREIGLNQ